MAKAPMPRKGFKDEKESPAQRRQHGKEEMGEYKTPAKPKRK